MGAAAAFTTPVVIVGAGPAGLAAAACLRRKGVQFRLFEQAGDVGSSWARHYDRLHLHTPAGASHLPFLRLPPGTPRYPSRDQFRAYLRGYCSALDIEPEFGQQVVVARAEGGGWLVRTTTHELRTPNLVVATGLNREPAVPGWPGLDAFDGPVLHSSAYRNGAPFRGRRVLVVGFGNSGAEIALDAHEHGAQVLLSVRAGANVVPRQLLGIPIVTLARWQSWWPARWADAFNAPVLARMGPPWPPGLARPAAGVLRRLREDQRVPVIDVGTMRLLASGEIGLRPAVERFTPQAVRFADGREEAIDAIVLATGYRTGLRRWLDVAPGVLARQDVPVRSGAESAPGLFFCGFRVAAAGMVREAGKEAARIAGRIACRL